MEKIRAPIVRVATGAVDIQRAGINAVSMAVSQEEVEFAKHSVPDIPAYLQEQTELTRSTLARILCKFGRLAELFVNPQRFKDAVAAVLNTSRMDCLSTVLTRCGLKALTVRGNGK